MTSEVLKVLQSSAWVAWVMLALSGVGLAYMMGDTSPPFRMLASSANTPKPGELLKAEAIVERQVFRDCSVSFSRHIIDSAGQRIDITGTTFMPADALRQLERATPGRLRLAVVLPSYVEPGPAHLVTPLAYVCNPWHALRPIEFVMTIPFEVKP